jgi:simple sugar transport system ATP-binding protein
VTETNDPLLELRSVSKRFGGKPALDAVSLALHAGEVIALVGDNGAGKSTLIKIAAGVFSPDGGEIRVRGTTRRFASPDAARAAGIETLYQDLALADNLDAGANIFLGREPVRRFLGIKVIDRRRMRAAAQAAAAALGVEIADFDAPVGRLSGGQRQVVAVGRAIQGGARIVLLDEPMAALGLTARGKLHALIARFRAEGRGVIFAAHDFDDIFAAADRIVVLRGGRLAGERARAATDRDEIAKLMLGD